MAVSSMCLPKLFIPAYYGLERGRSVQRPLRRHPLRLHVVSVLFGCLDQACLVFLSGSGLVFSGITFLTAPDVFLTGRMAKDWAGVAVSIGKAGVTVGTLFAYTLM